MIYKIPIVIGLLLIASTACADSELTKKYFSNSASPRLSEQERKALAVSEKWRRSNTAGIPPSEGTNGTVNYVFGTQQPSIICTVLQICDVVLQPGEQVNSIDIGDSARWTITPAIEGSGKQQIQHIIIKPLDVGLETSLLITTDQRAYHLQLRSHRTRYMPKVAFTYPEDSLKVWQQTKKREEEDIKERTIPETGEYLGDLSFDYRIESDGARWTPVRVYHDTQKTVIQMPKTITQTEAPTLLVIRDSGGLFTDDETVMVNYRVQGDRYIVDTIFDKAMLIAGVGANQDVVTITRGK